MHRSLRNGFTLVDLLLTLSIIAILLAVMLIQFKPGERMFNANSTVALKTAQEMRKATELYMSETGIDPGDDDILDGEGNKKYVCNYGLAPEEQTLANCVKLDELIDAGYLPELPRHFDWNRDYDDERVTGYTVYWSGGDPIFDGPRPPAALAFTGSTSVMAVADGDVLVDFDEPFSLVLWLKPLSADGTGIFFRKMTPDGTKGIGLTRNGQQLIVMMYADPSNALSLSASGFFQDPPNYRVIVLTYDGSGQSNGLILSHFVAGQLLTQEASGQNPLNGSVAVPNDLLIGGNGSSQPLNGLIDDVKIYDRVITEDEINALYGDSKDVEDGLVHHWSFDEGQGSTARDSRTDSISPLTATVWSEETQLTR